MLDKTVWFVLLPIRKTPFNLAENNRAQCLMTSTYSMDILGRNYKVGNFRITTQEPSKYKQLPIFFVLRFNVVWLRVILIQMAFPIAIAMSQQIQSFQNHYLSTESD